VRIERIAPVVTVQSMRRDSHRPTPQQTAWALLAARVRRAFTVAVLSKDEHDALLAAEAGNPTPNQVVILRTILGGDE
jgi:hypothetical protein